jgi:hypothetical protein
MAFASELAERYPDRVRIHASDETPAQLDFTRLVTRHHRGAAPESSCAAVVFGGAVRATAR